MVCLFLQVKTIFLLKPEQLFDSLRQMACSSTALNSQKSVQVHGPHLDSEKAPSKFSVEQP